MFCQILIESVSMGHRAEVHHLEFAPLMGGWVNVLINHPIHPWPWPWYTKAMTHIHCTSQAHDILTDNEQEVEEKPVQWHLNYVANALFIGLPLDTTHLLMRYSYFTFTHLNPGTSKVL